MVSTSSTNDNAADHSMVSTSSTNDNAADYSMVSTSSTNDNAADHSMVSTSSTNDNDQAKTRWFRQARPTTTTRRRLDGHLDKLDTSLDKLDQRQRLPRCGTTTASSLLTSVAA
jgi:hypothetical protein